MRLAFIVSRPSCFLDEETANAFRLAETLRPLSCQVRLLDSSNAADLQALAAGKIECQAVASFHLSRTGALSQDLAGRLRLPSVAFCAGPDVYVDFQQPGLGGHLRSIMNGFDKVILPFHSMATEVRECLVDARRMAVIPIGTLPKQVLPPTVPHPPDAPKEFLLLANRFTPLHNIPFAVKAVERARERHPDLHLVILGSGMGDSLEPDLLAMGALRPWIKVGQGDSIASTAAWMAVARLVINVSHAEGANPALLMAMQQGKGILASDIPGNRALVRDEWSNPGEGRGVLYLTSPNPEGYARIHDLGDFLQKLDHLLSSPETIRGVGLRASAYAASNLRSDLEAFLVHKMMGDLIGL